MSTSVKVRAKKRGRRLFWDVVIYSVKTGRVLRVIQRYDATNDWCAKEGADAYCAGYKEVMEKQAHG